MNRPPTRPELAALVQTYHLMAEMLELQAVASRTDQTATVRVLRRKEAEYRSALAHLDSVTAAFEAELAEGDLAAAQRKAWPLGANGR